MTFPALASSGRVLPVLPVQVEDCGPAGPIPNPAVLGYTLGPGNRVRTLRSAPAAPKPRDALAAPCVILQRPDGSPLGRLYGPALCASELHNLYRIGPAIAPRALGSKAKLTVRPAKCNLCGASYNANRSTSRYCGTRCRKAASRKH